MGLSSDLISQFVQITKEEKESKETTVYGTIVEYDGGKYVKLDGSELLTPISSTADAIDGERVTVMIKNHTALVTGNISSPSARSNSVKEIDGKVNDIGNKISEFEIIIADKVSVERLEAEIARIDTLVSENVTIKGRLDANEAEINNLIAENVTITGRLDVNEASIENLETKKLDAEIADIKYATIENLEAINAIIHNLEADYGSFKSLSTDNFSAINANIENLEATKLSVEAAQLTYANIDFSNIGKAAIEEFYSKSGLIENVVVGDGTITGTLVGVTIKGDLIEGGTIVADKLVIQGEDGLYYKLNTNGETVSSEQTEYNSLNGSIITAKSITATQISVSDLVAFDATIGGFNITDSSIYSGVKDSVDNTTRGVYFDKTGQLNIGDSTNFLKYYKDAEDGLYKLEISAGSIKMSATNKTVEEAINEIKIGGRNLLKPSCTAGSNTDNVDYYSIEITGEVSDTYFYANIYESLDVNQEYTLSYEIDYDGELNVQDWYFYVGVEGSAYTIPVIKGRQSITFVPLSTWDLTRLALNDNNMGETNGVVVKITNMMLERGNKASDWTPAPEDVEDSINKTGDELRTTIVNQRTDIINDCEQVILSALKQYVETSDYEEFKTTVSAQLSIMADEIRMNFEDTMISMENLDGDVQTKFTHLYKYISFSGDTAITIGSGDGSLTLELDNEKGIVFSKNGVAFGTWDGNNFYTGNIVVRLNERAQFGNFAFIPRSDGSLSFLKVGG